MGFKNVLNKMGLVEDEIPTVKQKASTVTSPQVPVTMQGVHTSTYSTSFTPATDIDPTIQKMLEDSLQENKLSGFDYLKFTSAVEEMKSTGTAEDARFKMAGFTAKQMGVDKAGLLKSGEHYLDVLSQDESDFGANCAEYLKKEITSRESSISKIESTITDLTKQLAQLQQDHSTLSQELQNETSRLESRKTAFQVTLKDFRATIESNIKKINQYL